MTNTNNGGPAFPSGLVEEGEDQVDALNKGMTLRDYFAAKAMVAIITDPHCEVEEGYDRIAVYAYSMADAMLRAREAS